MNNTKPQEDWNDQMEMLKLKFAMLTGNDLMFGEGSKDQVLEKLRIKLGMTKEEMLSIINHK